VAIEGLWRGLVGLIANNKETQLAHVALGERAEISVDTFPGHMIHGHVQGFAPASGRRSL
jgi:membrane fusion protein (multidrug efflux system)